ncbi:MAG: hypothetical protein U5K81_00015 [Trueperaceae bacterium]|nr:hypothetical protein [Trueperaceae bacterium]
MAPLQSDSGRPRGFSCEELGGAMWAPGDDLAAAERLTPLAPRFLSPHGTRSARYVRTRTTREGIFAIWQQAKHDGSQPLVTTFLANDEAAPTARLTPHAGTDRGPGPAEAGLEADRTGRPVAGASPDRPNGA